ncbi:BCCT family transporter [Levilactobacillus brevis]|uniref:BCCT family transporter n=1 Tax=Levilactobacillus brevis TaxID=1580 RepID=UPI0021E6C086|nr:BCCT family transporter [Levilactobacillus brevis]
MLVTLRYVVGDRLGVLFLALGVGCFLTTLYIAFSKTGNIRLGDETKPQYNNFTWGTMIFTSTMAGGYLVLFFNRMGRCMAVKNQCKNKVFRTGV